MALARSSGSRRRGRAVARTAVGAASAASFRNAPGAKAGCAFFAPGFFAQAKKGGSRRHGAKALDLDSCCRTGEEQEQLAALRSEEHTSELQSLMRISYAVFFLKKKKSH